MVLERNGGTALSRIGSAILLAWCFAAVYSGLAVVLFAGGPSRQGLPLVEVIALYWLAATLIGAIVGWLRPLATTPERRFGVALLGSWPAVLGIYVIVNRLALSDLGGFDLSFITALSVMFAVWGANQEDL